MSQLKIYIAPLNYFYINIDEKTVLRHTVMGDSYIEVNYTEKTKRSYIFSTEGHYIIYKGNKYTLVYPPIIKKMAGNMFNYILRFYGPEQIIKNIALLPLNLSGANGFYSEFSLIGDAETFLDMIIESIDSRYSGLFDKNIVVSTDDYVIEFSNDNCLSALQKVCSIMDVEFEIILNPSNPNNYLINIKSVVGSDSGHTLRYGAGLTQIDEVPTDDDIVTVVYPYGASKNLPDNYENKRLFSLGSITYGDTSAYGFREKIVFFNEVFPRFEGVVESASGDQFTDSTIDFDINSYLLSGVAAKIVFRSGKLSGYEFDIQTFDNGTKTVNLVHLKDESGRLIPSTELNIQIGDRYTIVDILMPSTYITNAYAELATKAQDYIDRYGEPIYTYQCMIDSHYCRINGIELNAADTVTIIDKDYNLNESLRVFSIEKQLVDEYKCKVTFCNRRYTDRLIRLQRDQYNTNTALRQLQVKSDILRNI